MNAIIGWAMPMLLVIGLAVSGVTAQTPRGGRPTGTTTAPAPPRPADLSVRLWVDADRIQVDDEVRVWTSIQNRGGQNAEDVRFDVVSLRGFEHVGDCWLDNTPACPAGSEKPLQMAPLRPGAEIARWARLKRTQRQPGRSLLFGSIQWRDATSQSPNHQIPIAVNTPIELMAAPSRISLTTLATILAALITAMFAWIVQRRVERQALLATNLPKNLRNAEKYLLPLQSSGLRIVEECRKLRTGDARGSRHSLLFHWLQFNRRMRDLQHGIGGFYFQLREGEQLAADAWDTLKILEWSHDSAAVNPLSRVHMALAIDHVDSKETEGTFLGSWEKNDQLKVLVPALAKELEAWLTQKLPKDVSNEAALRCIELFDDVLAVEIDRPHEAWYRSRVSIDRRQYNEWMKYFRGCAENLEAQHHRDVSTKLAATIERYVVRNSRRGRLKAVSEYNFRWLLP
jgi:hypothetical protein